MNSRDEGLLAKCFLLAVELQRLLLVNRLQAEEALGMEKEIDLSERQAEQAQQDCSSARLQLERLEGELAAQKAASESLARETKETQLRELAAAREEWEQKHSLELKAVQDSLLRDLRIEVERVRKEEKLKYDAKLAQLLLQSQRAATKHPPETRPTQASPIKMSYTFDSLRNSEAEVGASGPANGLGKYRSLMVASKRRSVDVKSVGERSSDLSKSHLTQSALVQESAISRSRDW